MSRLVESDECERCGDRLTGLRRPCSGCTRDVRDARGAVMSSRTSPLESQTARGDAIEATIVQDVDEREDVGDRTATWHDARTTTLLEPRRSLPFYGIVLVEPGVPIEIKGCQIETSSGSRSTRGRFYVKRAAHKQLLDAAGMYLFVVYLPRPGLPQVARAIVPATIAWLPWRRSCRRRRRGRPHLRRNDLVFRNRQE